jgi:Glycosyl hydrolases family 32 N-terminal domain
MTGQLPGTQLVKFGLVLRRGGAGAWDAGMVESPTVWFDEQRRCYGMVYTGYAHVHPDRRGYGSVSRPQVGLAWSDDLLRWEKEYDNPIFGPSDIAGSPDSHGTSGPLMWHEHGAYYLFYFGTTAAGYECGTKTLNLATSSDLHTWKRYEGNPIIAPSGEGWRREAIWHPNIVNENGIYFLFFNASGIVGSVNEEFIGFATSNDLLHWTVDDARSPVLVGSGTPGSWDARYRTGDPSIFKVGDRWYMAYYSWDGIHSQDGIAWTTADEFPVGWRAWEGNPVLRIGPGGSYDALHAAKPFIYRTLDRHYHFYTAVDDNESREIALCTWPPL